MLMQTYLFNQDSSTVFRTVGVETLEVRKEKCGLASYTWGYH